LRRREAVQGRQIVTDGTSVTVAASDSPAALKGNADWGLLRVNDEGVINPAATDRPVAHGGERHSG
jgi:hypothetical protein